MRGAEILRPALALGAGVLLAVGAGEFILSRTPSLIDNPPGQFRRSQTRAFEHTPNFRGRDRFGNEIRINSLGFRERELDRKKPAGTVRILVLGDSVAFGDGVSAEEAFPRRLEERFASKSGSVEVLNAGVRGYNTYQELCLLREVGLALGPDTVILFYTTNDAEPLSKQEGLIDPRFGWAVQAKDFVKKHSYLYAFFRKNFEVLRKNTSPEKFMETYNDQFDPKSPGWAASYGSLKEMKALADTLGARLALAVYPRLEWSAQKYPPASDRVHRQVLDAGRSLGIETIDLLPPLMRGAPDVSAIKITPSDTFHPNPKGHRLIAEILGAYLETA